MPLSPGIRIGEYEVIESVGSGGMGEVYRARDSKLGRDVAIKVLPDEMAADADRLRRFEQEARAASALNHPNIVTIHEIGEHEGAPYIAMEYVDGRTLREILSEGPLSHDKLIRYATQMVEGLSKAHQARIVHRDLKPENVVISEDDYVKILDFGLAKLSARDAVDSEVGTAVKEDTMPGTILGTVGYMSPEQAKGEAVDFRSDQFSFGAILYEMALGKRAFDSRTTAESLAAVLKEELSFDGVKGTLVQVLTKCLKKNPGERWDSTTALLEALRSADSSNVADSVVPSVAVLSFENMSGDPDQSYFSDGITEDIITDLSKVSSIFVVARNSSFTYKGRSVKTQDICTDLGVRYVVEGSVRKSGKKVRITAQLIDGTTGGHIWADRYDGTLDDIFELQDEVACQIVDALRIRLLPEEKRAIQYVPTVNIQGYEYYLKGRQLFHSFTGASIREAQDYFKRAIACDESYALAYCGLAESGSFLNYFHGGDHTTLVDATLAAAKAVELAPDLAESHASLGLVLSSTGDYSGAEKEFRVAVDLDPNLYEAHYYWARACFAEGKLEEAAKRFETAWERSPKDPQTPALLLQIYRSLGRQTDLEHAARETVKIGLQKLEAEPGNWRTCLSTAFGFLNLGEFDEVRNFLARALEHNADDGQVNYNAACLYCGIGDFEKAVHHLEVSLKQKNGPQFLAWIENDSDLDPLRDHAKFQELLEIYS